MDEATPVTEDDNEFNGKNEQVTVDLKLVLGTPEN